MSRYHIRHLSRMAAATALGGALILGTCGVAVAGADAHHHHHGYYRTHVDGRITALVGSTVTITRADGAVDTYATTTSTLYFEGGVATTPAALALGEAVDLTLAGSAPQTIARLTIDVVRWSGVVSAVSGGAITLGPTGAPRTVQTSSSTSFLFGNGTSATLADALVGDTVVAKGVNTPTARTIFANSVVIFPAHLATHVCGRITALGSGSVTLKRCGGATATYATTSSTLYFEAGVATTASALALGESVDLVLTPTAPQSVVRLSIDVVHWSGVVSAVSGGAITIGPTSSPRTIETLSSTTFLFGNGTSATLTDALVGDTVSAKGVNTTTAGTISANSVVIYPAHPSTHVSGRITALGSGSVTIKRGDGSTATYATTSSTLYFEGATATKSAALAVGGAVTLALTSASPQTVVSLTIAVIKFTGTVAAISGDVITVTTHSGTTEIVTVSSTTTYALSGGGAATLSDVLIGDQIAATGVNGVGSLTLSASSVVIGSFL